MCDAECFYGVIIKPGTKWNQLKTVFSYPLLVLGGIPVFVVIHGMYRFYHSIYTGIFLIKIL